MEQLANNPVTTLASSITNVATTLSVTSATAFPTSGPFTIKIDSELLRVTGVSGTTFTVTRAQESTTGAAHSSSATVTLVVTANSVFRLFTEMTQVGGYSSRPSTPRAGTEYRASDINLGWTYGTNWDLTHPFYVPYANRVNTSGWTNMNIGSLTWTDINGVTVVTAPTRSGANLAGKYHTIPTAPFKMHTIIGPPPIHQSESQIGLLLYDSGTTKAKNFAVQTYDNGARWIAQNWTSPTSFSSNLTNLGQQVAGYPYLYLRLYDDNTNWIWSTSQDGQHWVDVWQETRNTWLTPTHCGLCIFRNSAPTSYNNNFTFYGYWEI